MRVPTLVRVSSAVVLLAALTPMPAAQAAEFDVEVADFFFAPDELFVNAGDTVIWTWTGVAPHDVTPVQAEAFPASETVSEGTHEVTFETPGEVPYFCSLHGSPDGTEGMVGVVNVLAEGAPLPEPPPEPRPAPSPGRLPVTEDAAATALAWSSLFADGSVTEVLIGRDDLFADSLTSGALQGLLDGPLLLTASAALDERVAEEVRRLGASRATIMGGTAAISADVEQQLRDLGLVVGRVEGPTRIETAVDAAATFFSTATEAFLVRSDAAPGAGDPTQAFADSLTVGGMAAREAIPVLLSQTEQLSASTRAHLAASSIDTVYVVGGVAALSEQVQVDLEALDIEARRIAGDTRFGTMRELAHTFFPGPPDLALLVDGQAPDAWVSGFTAASAAESAPILLANGPDLPIETIDLLLVALPSPAGVPALCGPRTDRVACDRADLVSATVSLPSPDVRMAQMQGDTEVPGPGQDVAKGDFLLMATPADDAICYEIATYQIGEPVTGAHIHTGGPGVAGDVVIALTTPGERTFLRDCQFDLDPAVVADVRGNPGAHYVNYHTATFPAGAVRGQLFRPQVIGIVELQPASVVPPSGAQGGGFSFFAADVDDDTRVCYFMGFSVQGETAQAADIRQAPAGENGPVVAPLELPPVDPASGGAEGTMCITVTPEVRNALLSDPSAHYVDVRTAAHPDGALRGQLFNPFAGPPPGGPPGPAPGA